MQSSLCYLRHGVVANKASSPASSKLAFIQGRSLSQGSWAGATLLSAVCSRHLFLNFSSGFRGVSSHAALHPFTAPQAIGHLDRASAESDSSSADRGLSLSMSLSLIRTSRLLSPAGYCSLSGRLGDYPFVVCM
jgi:hypothetical protein